MPLLEALGAILWRVAPVAFVIGVVIWIMRRFGDPPPELQQLTRPPAPAPPPRCCRYCSSPATRSLPRIEEHRPWLERLRVRWTLPVELTPSCFRRAAGGAELEACDLHGAIADHQVDVFLEGQRLQLATYLRDQALRTTQFARVGLAAALEPTRIVPAPTFSAATALLEQGS